MGVGRLSSEGPRVAVVGAGLGGIAAAYNLSRAGLDFTVFERSGGPGGTWYDNDYPGCGVDIHAHQYSYSFHRGYPWTRTHPMQGELQRYCEDTIDRFGLRPHFRFGLGVESVAWDEGRSVYRVRTADGAEHLFNIVVSALGLLNNPRYPDWPGLESFDGPKFHTSRWEHEHDLTGKRVAVVGVGSSGAQVVPAIAPIVGKLYVFQREPGWVLPKAARDLSEEERGKYARFPQLVAWNRLRAFQLSGKLMGAGDLKSKHNKMLHEMSLQYLEATFEDEDLRAAVTPDYPWGCKRPVLDDNFYPALTLENVELVPRAVARVTPTSVVDADGVERDIDVLIMATGFTTTTYLASLDARGPGGRRIQELWGDSESFLGITVAGMPNFFMLYGPNTNAGGSIIGQLERQSEVMVRAAQRMRRTGARVVDTRKAVMTAYVRWVDRRNNLRRTAERECNNYYFNRATGRNVTQAHLTGFGYWAVTRALPRLGLVYRPGEWVSAARDPPEALSTAAAMRGTVDPELAPVVPLIPDFPFSDIEGSRAALEAMLASAPPLDAGDVVVADRKIPGAAGGPEVGVRIFTPDSGHARIPAVLDIHSGGFAMGSVAFNDAANVALARELGVVVVSVDYRLAPEHPYPAAAEDCYAALRWLAQSALELDIDPRRIAVMGDSAGGALAASTVLLARDRGGPAVAFQALVEPVLDDRLATPSMRLETIAWYRSNAELSWEYYLGGAEADHYAAPARMADLARLPPTFVSVNELDCVRDEGLDYARRLLESGVSTEVHCWPGAFHGFHLTMPGATISCRALAATHDALRRALWTGDHASDPVRGGREQRPTSA
jgi:cation diffusion facilitator CzcD-associated flavoprotein CzcO/acetyl esterase/lipase